LPEQLAGLLEDGLSTLSVATNPALIQNLLRYIELLDHWNQRVNLTAVRKPRDMVVRHLLDALSIAPHVTQSSLVDIGSGAGLPGIPMALLNTEQQWHLVDSSGKRVSFMREVVRQLELKNVQVSHSRIEEFQPPRKFPAAIARAFASLGEIADNASHLLLPEGTLWAMKGRYPQAELADLPANFHLVKVLPLEVPGLLEDRHLVQLSFKPET